VNIEFLGLPGSGKSTVANRLSEFDDAFVHITSQGDKAIRKSKYFRLFLLFKYFKYFLHPVWFKVWMSLDYISIRVIVPGILMMAYFEEIYSKKNTIFDEGWLQKGYSIFHNQAGLSGKYLEFFLDNINLPDVVVLLDIGEHDAYKRMESRTVFPIRMRGMTKDLILEDLKNGNIWVDNIINKFEERGLKVIKVSANDDIDTIIRSIRCELHI